MLSYTETQALLSQTVQFFAYVFVLFLGFIQFFFLCLSLCRSTTAHAHINKELLWCLSERTPATAVAVRTEKLLCDFQKPIQSYSAKCGSQSTVYGFQENHMTDQIMGYWLELENIEQSQDLKGWFTN